jgi:hypothetical protein
MSAEGGAGIGRFVKVGVRGEPAVRPSGAVGCETKNQEGEWDTMGSKRTSDAGAEDPAIHREEAGEGSVRGAAVGDEASHWGDARGQRSAHRRVR